MARKRIRQDEHPVPGGAYIMDADQREDDETGEVKHYGGRVVNAQGETIREFPADEENTGLPEGSDRPKAKAPSAAWRSTPTADLDLDGATLSALQAAGLRSAGDLADRIESGDAIEGVGEAREGKIREALDRIR